MLERVPASRRADLVFAQNGMLRPWLEAEDLGQATRGLLFMAVPQRGAPIEPGSDSPFHGPRAAAVVAGFRAADLPAREVDAAQFAAIELEKLIWNSAFGLLCQAHDERVGEVVDRHPAELRELVAELARVGRAALGVDLELDPLVDRLAAYSRTIADYRGAVREWRWRNGWFVDEARARGVATPVHDRLLDRAGARPA